MSYRDDDPVKQVTILDAQHSNLDEEIVEEVRRLWRNAELGNNTSYYPSSVEVEEWETDDDPEYSYPKLIEYLKNRGIKHILIHYWW